MEKKTIIALLAVVALGTGAFFVLRAPEKGQRRGPPPRPIAELKSDSIDRLDVTSEKQEHTALVKKGGGWRLESGADWGADPQAVKALVDALGKLTFGDLVTESADKLADLGVVDGKAARVVIGSGGKTLADLIIGKQVGGFTMVRPAGKNDVWQSTGLYSYQVNRDTKGWRDKTVFEFPAPSVQKLTVEGRGSKLTLEKAGDSKPGEPAKWKIVEATGDAPKTLDALDLVQVNGAVQSLAGLKASDFADDQKPEETGLKNPWLTVTVTVENKPHALYVGDAKGDDVFIRTTDSATAFSVKKYALDRIAHAPIDYRDKTLVKVKADDLTAVAITVGAETVALDQSGGKWHATPPAHVDENKVKPVVSAFENLNASGFAVDKDPVKTGLAKPAGQVVLKLKDKSTVTIKIGAATADGADYYLQKLGSPDVYLVKKFMVDRFWKKPADLAPSAAPAAPTKTPTKKK